ncbi:MFS transporter [Streptomyces sp. f51]|uniref:MFS transporter n=1 Tax=unclassified Streptomyces TaxID=2593676 RepID=UPI0030D5CA2E
MVLINRDYRLLWVGQLVSQTGDFAFSTTLSLWIGTVVLAGRPYAPAAVSALVVVMAVGTLLVGPAAGVFVDRWDHRRTMLGADLVRAVLIGSLTVVAFLPGGTLSDTTVLVAVYVTVLLSTAAAQFFNPARFALISEVVEPEQRARAAGIGQATQAIAVIAGPPLAAPLLFSVGVRWALLLNAVSFLVSLAAVRAVRPTRKRPVTGPEVGPGPATAVPPGQAPAAQVSSVRAEFLDGLRMVTRSRPVTALVVTIVLVTIGADALNSLNVFFVTDNLGAASRWYGTLEMALGFGLVAGALGTAWLAGRLSGARVFSTCLILTGIGLVAYSRLTGLGPAIVVLAVTGIPLAAVNASLTPVLLDHVPQSHLGRVIAVINPVQQLAALVGVSAAGWLASTVLRGFSADIAGVRFGRIDTILTFSGLLVIAGGVYATAALRSAHRPARQTRRPGDRAGSVSGAPGAGR